jgi:hypothetical protein
MTDHQSPCLHLIRAIRDIRVPSSSESVNRADGFSEIEGKAAKVAASERGRERVSKSVQSVAFFIRLIRGSLEIYGISEIRCAHFVLAAWRAKAAQFET